MFILGSTAAVLNFDFIRLRPDSFTITIQISTRRKRLRRLINWHNYLRNGPYICHQHSYLLSFCKRRIQISKFTSNASISIYSPNSLFSKKWNFKLDSATKCFVNFKFCRLELHAPYTPLTVTYNLYMKKTKSKRAELPTCLKIYLQILLSLF